MSMIEFLLHIEYPVDFVKGVFVGIVVMFAYRKFKRIINAVG